MTRPGTRLHRRVAAGDRIGELHGLCGVLPRWERASAGPAALAFAECRSECQSGWQSMDVHGRLETSNVQVRALRSRSKSDDFRS
jgi:hypothetical protein